MFNYLMIAEIIVNKIKESSPDLKDNSMSDIMGSKREEFIKYTVDNQMKLFGDTKLEAWNVDTLLDMMPLIIEYNQYGRKNPKYNNGNLSILPLEIIRNTTHIHSLSTFILNLLNIDGYYRSNFVEENYYDWANKLLDDLYIRSRLTEVSLYE